MKHHRFFSDKPVQEQVVRLGAANADAAAREGHCFSESSSAKGTPCCSIVGGISLERRLALRSGRAFSETCGVLALFVQAENKVVHPKAKWIFASKDNRLYIRNQEQGTKALKQKASRGTVPPPATLKIGSMDITGDAASLKMEIEFPLAVSTYYLILLKLAGEWKIVGGTISARQK